MSFKSHVIEAAFTGSQIILANEQAQRLGWKLLYPRRYLAISTVYALYHLQPNDMEMRVYMLKNNFDEKSFTETVEYGKKLIATMTRRVTADDYRSLRNASHGIELDLRPVAKSMIKDTLGTVCRETDFRYFFDKCQELLGLTEDDFEHRYRQVCCPRILTYVHEHLEKEFLESGRNPYLASRSYHYALKRYVQNVSCNELAAELDLTRSRVYQITDKGARIALSAFRSYVRDLQLADKKNVTELKVANSFKEILLTISQGEWSHVQETESQ